MGQRRYLAPWRRPGGGSVASGLAAWEEVLSGEAGKEAARALVGKPAIYHCISRVVDRRLILGEAEKEHFTGLLRRFEAFCQVRILTFCVMSNHFHVLVEVPARPAQDPDDEALLSHLTAHYPEAQWREIRWQLGHFREQGNHRGAERLRQRFLSRMWDLSAFIQSVKQCFSRWYNRRKRRCGHLWEERFKSVLVEDGYAARVVAAYIDLNPLRAGIVAAAHDYRWSGWGEATAGKRQAREGIQWVLFEHSRMTRSEKLAAEVTLDWRQVADAYRQILEADEQRKSKSVPTEGRVSKQAGVGERNQGRGGGGAGPSLDEGSLLRTKVRYFSDGLVLGSRDFVNHSFDLTKDWFSRKRTTGARRLASVETELCAMRALRLRRYEGDDA